MTTKSNLEHEMKYEAEPDFTFPDLRVVGAETVRLPEQALRTRYFDTPDLRLWQRGLTLRHRSGENGAGKWTLKLPEEGAGAMLDRAELSWHGGPDDVPQEAAHVVRGIVGRAVLGPVGELEATRKRTLILGPAGTPVAEVDDDVITVIHGRRNGGSFRQIEVECMNGDEEPDSEVITEVMKELERAGATLDHEQKFEKALGLPRASRTITLAQGNGRRGGAFQHH